MNISQLKRGLYYMKIVKLSALNYIFFQLLFLFSVFISNWKENGFTSFVWLLHESLSVSRGVKTTQALHYNGHCFFCSGNSLTKMSLTEVRIYFTHR